MKSPFKIIIAFSISYFIMLPLQFGQVKFDLTTNANEWMKGVANINLNLQPLKSLSISGGADYSIGIDQLSQYERKFNTRTYNTELRFFPFGIRNIKLNKELMPWEKRARFNKKTGCNSFRKSSPHFLKGIYLAPGFFHSKTELDYIPNDELESPVSDFHFTVVDKGLSLDIGYQIRISKFTLGVSYGILISKPHWQGPVDIFEDSLYTSTYPFKHKREERIKLNVGFNF